MHETVRRTGILARALDAERGPTAVALGIVRRGSPPSVESLGGIRSGTRFDLASVSKIVTTLAIMRLRATGALDPDTPVHALLPVFHGGAKDRVTVRVIPFDAGAHVGVSGPFTLLEFDGDLSDVLYLEWRRTASTLVSGDDPRIAQCADDFESLLDDALPREESVALIKRVAEEMS